MHEVHFDLLWIGHMLDIRERESLFDIGVESGFLVRSKDGV